MSGKKRRKEKKNTIRITKTPITTTLTLYCESVSKGISQPVFSNVSQNQSNHPNKSCYLSFSIWFRFVSFFSTASLQNHFVRVIKYLWQRLIIRYQKTFSVSILKSKKSCPLFVQRLSFEWHLLVGELFVCLNMNSVFWNI